MLKKGDQQYTKYLQIKEKNCMQMICLSSQTIEDSIQTIRHLKTSITNNINNAKIQVSLDQQNQIFQMWEDSYQQALKDDENDPFEYSVFKIFRKQTYFAVFIELFGFLCHSITPFILYFVYHNIVNHKINTEYNKILISAIVFCRLMRTLCCYYSQLQLNSIGLKMYKLVSSAIVNKTLKCSPLSNKNISITQLSKMMHTDCENLLLYPSKLAFALENILSQIVLSVIVICISGWAGVIGILILFTNLFWRGLFKQFINKTEKELNILSSQRIKATIQTFHIIKYIKANALQSCYFNKLRQLRIIQVAQLKIKLYQEMIQNTAVTMGKPITIVIVVKLLVLWGNTFDVQVLFTVYLCIIIINMQAILNALTYVNMIETSLKNIEDFMKERQLNLNHLTYVNEPTSQFAIQISKGNFKWDCSEKENSLQNNLHELKNINIKIKKKQLVAIIGGYGTGKSSLFNCILGQMEKIGEPKIIINGSIAYAGQVPWIMSDTIRNNILFGKPFDQKKYSQVLKYAALQADLPLFPNRDLSMIGRRGSTLSGGQRARVSFARALYSDADIYILDDILSAVDAHVGSFLFFMGIKQYLANKTVLLITHSLYYVQHTDRILVFDKGQIIREGTYSQLKTSSIFQDVQSTAIKTSSQYENILLNNNTKLSKLQSLKQPQNFFDTQISISQSFKVYIQRNSGVIFVIIMGLFVVVIGMIGAYTCICLNSWSLSPVRQQNYYLYLSLLLNAIKVILTILMARVLHISKIYQTIHDDMIKSLLFSPYSYFEKVPTDKIINRLSNDLEMNDKIITSQFAFLLTNAQFCLIYLLSILYVYILFSSYYYIAFLILYLAGTYCLFSKFFSFSISIHKLQQQLIIPINSKYSQILDGLSTIRAYKKVQIVVSDFWNKMSAFAMSTTIRYIVDAKIKLFLLSSTNLLLILVIITLVFFDHSFDKYTVFVLFSYFSFQDVFMRYYLSLTAFAPRLESLGKCEELTKLQPQKGYINYLQNNWIQDEPFKSIYYKRQIFPKGQIIFENYSLKYKPELQNVLKNLTLTVRPGEKIGIVGRTGSGKSTMMLALLRIIEASQGRIIIDGVDIGILSLEELRSNINIILQDHFLFTGTVKDNVDPTQSHTDQKVVETLKLCGIWEEFEKREGVNTAITEGGDNLSAGEKQLINIARSLLNPKRIVLIDQATASIDLQTDSMIQKVMKNQFADKTVLTIAHRINTVIDSDRILVLDKGKIAEFDSPANLLSNQDSVFAKLYKQSGKNQQDKGLNL